MALRTLKLPFLNTNFLIHTRTIVEKIITRFAVKNSKLIRP